MAIARCEKCGRPTGRGGNVYSGPDEPGLVWLLDREQALYKTGTRIFVLARNVNHTKLAVQ